MNVLAWIGFSQALFATLLLVSKRNKSVSDTLLVIFMGFAAFEFLSIGFSIEFKQNIYLSNPFLFLNPLIYLYAKSLTQNNFKFKWRYVVHILPYFAIIFLSRNFDVYYTLDTLDTNDHSHWLYILLNIVSFISYSTYFVLTIININRHRKRVKEKYASDQRRQMMLGWLLAIVSIFLIFTTTLLILGTINIIIQNTTYLVAFNYAFLLILVYLFGFYGSRQDTRLLVNEDSFNKDIQNQYKNPRIAPLTANSYKAQLMNYFEKHKPYLDSDLSMESVAEKLSLNRYKLTELLNNEIGKNFYQFVNEYRIDEAKDRLVSEKYNNISIDAIGYDCGFNSRSSFYSVFKKMTGMTPKQYKEEMKQS